MLPDNPHQYSFGRGLEPKKPACLPYPQNIGWSITELLSQCLEIPKERQTMCTTRRAAAILNQLGCVKARSRMWGRRWRWFKSQEEADSAAQRGKPMS